jgi:hypothetical protein
MQHLLEEAGASMEDVNYDDQTFWDLLIANYYDEEEEEPAALPNLLGAMVLRAVRPPAPVALLSPERTRVVQEGTRLLARLPLGWARPLNALAISASVSSLCLSQFSSPTNQHSDEMMEVCGLDRRRHIDLQKCYIEYNVPFHIPQLLVEPI